MLENKEWWKSKTMIANVLVIVAGILTALSGELAAGGVISGISVLNIVLRTVTQSKISW